MLNRALMISALTGVLILAGSFSFAADQEQVQQPAKAKIQKQIYGSQLMTKEERAEYRSKMRAAKTADEREQIRKEHHERMKERAKERGVTLPDNPPARGGGTGCGCGCGCGMEPGCGMGCGCSTEPGCGMGSGGGRNR